MNKSELNFFAALLKKATDLFTNVNVNKTTEVLVPVQAVSYDSYAGGICRTPADSTVLRLNLEPWS
ncbi:hypothetical protein [Polluticoccus soli]|uniref:hypothetical protein n=1 Tax=Polluticoccus soli TaxID=3034150 RepID=UPI0023E31076|nr:hypothetical protein [Flavipsychrobacter sp. JY13-12]